MSWKANAAHIDAAPSPATAPSSQFGRVKRPSALRNNMTVPTYASG